MGDIAADVVCALVLQRASRVVEGSAIGANVIHHQDVLALQFVITLYVNAKDFASFPIALLDAKRNRKPQGGEKVAVPLAGSLVREEDNVNLVQRGLENVLDILLYAVEVHIYPVKQRLAYGAVWIGNADLLKPKPVDCLRERLEGENLLLVLHPVHPCVGDVWKVQPDLASLVLEMLRERNQLKQLIIAVIKPGDGVFVMPRVKLQKFRSIGKRRGLQNLLYWSNVAFNPYHGSSTFLGVVENSIPNQIPVVNHPLWIFQMTSI